ncbi:MAG: 2-oxoglutarate dehydrogenase E1 component, partial [Deltaproteobacteria bacterium]|nr:2-oxoglutarate dehydrogenase E1 component [Deltaproteobacteria bacterium]
AERQWLRERMEPGRNRPVLSREEKVRILNKLYQASLFEQFLHKKYLGQTRFSLEGAEALIPMLDSLVGHVAAQGCREIILGMAHRGRLNVQVNVLEKSYEEIFCEFESNYDPDTIFGAGDVKYHNGFLADITTANDRSVRMLLVNNPSHLESVNPVVEGFARARQDMIGSRDGHRLVLPL